MPERPGTTVLMAVSMATEEPLPPELADVALALGEALAKQFLAADLAKRKAQVNTSDED